MKTESQLQTKWNWRCLSSVGKAAEKKFENCYERMAETDLLSQQPRLDTHFDFLKAGWCLQGRDQWYLLEELQRKMMCGMGAFLGSVKTKTIMAAWCQRVTFPGDGLSCLGFQALGCAQKCPRSMLPQLCSTTETLLWCYAPFCHTHSYSKIMSISSLYTTVLPWFLMLQVNYFYQILKFVLFFRSHEAQDGHYLLM